MFLWFRNTGEDHVDHKDYPRQSKPTLYVIHDMSTGRREQGCQPPILYKWIITAIRFR